MRHTESKWTACDGTDMHAVRWSPDTTPVMVVCLIHGLGEHSGRYEHMAKHFVSVGIEVVAFDLRGHGKSDGQRGHTPELQQMIRDIDRFLNHASNIDLAVPHFIYGHSLGGTLAIKYALYHSGEYKGVIISSPMFKPAFEPPKWKVFVGKKIQSIWPSLSFNSEVDIKTLCRDTLVLEDIREDELNHDRISAKLGAQLLEEGERLLEEASAVNFPLLMMHGDADELTCHKATTMFSECAGDKCTLKIWEDFYHELHHEPEKLDVYNYCINWMRRHVNTT